MIYFLFSIVRIRLSRCIPCITNWVKGPIYTLQCFSTDICSLFRRNTTLITESRTCCEKSSLSLYALCHSSRNKTLSTCAKHIIVTIFVGTDILIPLRHFIIAVYILIISGKQFNGIVTVRENLSDTCSKGRTWLIEIRSTILWIQVDRKTHNLTIHLTNVSTQQVEEVQTAESQCITLIKVAVHHVE